MFKKNIIKTNEEIEKMRRAGKLAASILFFLEPYIKVGISGKDIDELCLSEIKRKGAKSATLNYHGFPASVCVSVNDVVCHGIPDKNVVLKNGDIVNVDVTVIVDGYHGDVSRMFKVGTVSKEASLLIDRTKEAMHKGIEVIKPEVCISEIGRAIENYTKKFGYSIVRDYGGHGIGKGFHENLHVHHYYNPNYKVKLLPGMTFTVEPMINLGKSEVKVSGLDHWTVRTADGSLSAQYEHTVLVTNDSYEILTEIKS